jgi:hypothetical protein
MAAGSSFSATGPLIEIDTASGWRAVAQPAGTSVTLSTISTRADGFTMVVGFDTGEQTIVPYSESELAA